MLIESLKIKKFRNLIDISIVPSQGINVICGENGQGKTNILEAIWLFTGTKSFLFGTEKEMIPFDSDFCEASLAIRNKKVETKLRYRLGENKKIERNLIKETRLSDFSSYFNAVIFSPDHLLLVKGGPVERRKAMDQIICQLKPRYNVLLSQHMRLMAQRNALLKQCKEKSESTATLEEWDRALAKAGSLITKTRRSYAKLLIPKACEVYHGISAGREVLNIEYKSWGETQEITAENLFNEMSASRERDIRQGVTTVGSHKDDLEITINENSARNFASQGQQRSIVLALKIAECDLMEEISENRPVILLDDVLSELDESRREFLLNKLSDRQIFITCCDYNQIKNVSSVFQISRGRLV